jgi:hypothetical protein
MSFAFAKFWTNSYSVQHSSILAEPVFLNVYGAEESIPRNEFRQPM